MELYEDQFDERHDSPGTRPTRTLVIASTPRSGSHMLGHSLHETGAFGFPLEYLNPRNLVEWRKRLRCTTTSEVLEELMHRRSSSGGVFSIKLHYDHVFELGSPPPMSQFFPDPRVVLITRRDLVAQGVSHSRAVQTGGWIAGQPAADIEPHYNFREIDRLMRKAARDNASWAHLLSITNLPWIHLAYEDIVADMGNALLRIAELMDISLEPRAIPLTPPTAQQGSSVSSEWASRFRQQTDASPLFTRTSTGRTQLKRALARRLPGRR